MKTQMKKRVFLIVCAVLLAMVLIIAVSYIRYIVNKPVLRIVITSSSDFFMYSTSRDYVPTETEIEFKRNLYLIWEDICCFFTGSSHSSRKAIFLELKENGEIYWLKGLRTYENDLTKPVYIRMPVQVQHVKLKNDDFSKVLDYIKETFPSHGELEKVTDSGVRALWWNEYPEIIIKEDAYPGNDNSGIDRIYDLLMSYLPQ